MPASESVSYVKEAFGLGGILLGAIMTFVFTELRSRRERRRGREGHFEALKAELQLCSAMAGWYLSEPYRSPAYRLPTVAFDRSLPLLLAEGVLSESESSAVIQFYVTVKSLNLCLDYVHQALWEGHKSEEQEASRARLKAQSIVPGVSGRRTEYDSAMGAILRHHPGEPRAIRSTKSQEGQESSGAS